MFSLSTLKICKDIFMAFIGPATLTFGGGPSAIPLIQQQVVENYKWLTIEQFTDALALGNSLPGPIATKMGALIGYRVAGWLGAVVALLTTVVPTALAIILLSSIYFRFKDAGWLKGMMKAVRPVVVILVAQVVWEMSPKSFTNWQTGIIAAVAVIAIAKLNIHPAILIISALCYGGIFFR